MAKKNKVSFYCQECGYNSPRWLGKCPACNEWNTFTEEVDEKLPADKISRLTSEPSKVFEIESTNDNRMATAIGEFDRVLGGGVIKGSLALIGGDPGIGKSTLLLQAANNIAASDPVLYVSGEESKEQIKLRATRLGAASPNLFISAETNIDKIEGFIKEIEPSLVVIDSIQTMFLPAPSSAPGSVAQVRECTSRLLYIGKSMNIPIFIVGHITKAGSLAGPRVMEHIVDTVLYFEGLKHHSFRVLRAEKNRFGSTNEIGVFQMLENGLNEVENPSGLFLAERPLGSSGSIVTATMEGTRPVLIEVQALVSDSPYGTPRRLSTGLEINRMFLMVAVLEKRLGMMLGSSDIYLNAVGGIKITEPAADLGICAAVASSFKNQPTSSDTVIFGEVGLAGEVRAVSQIEKRIAEAAKMDFSRVILPYKNKEGIDHKSSVKLVGVKSLEEALEEIICN